jgi:hypothetical protein
MKYLVLFFAPILLLIGFFMFIRFCLDLGMIGLPLFLGTIAGIVFCYKEFMDSQDL